MIDFDLEIDNFTEKLLDEAKKALVKEGRISPQIILLFRFTKDPDKLGSMPLPGAEKLVRANTPMIPGAIQEFYDTTKQLSINHDYPIELLAVVLLSDIYYAPGDDPFNREIKPVDHPQKGTAIYCQVNKKDSSQSNYRYYKQKETGIKFTGILKVSNAQLEGNAKELFPEI